MGNCTFALNVFIPKMHVNSIDRFLAVICGILQGDAVRKQGLIPPLSMGSFAERSGVAAQVTMGGGYPRDLDPLSGAFRDVVQAHMDVYRACASAHARLDWAGPPWPWVD